MHFCVYTHLLSLAETCEMTSTTLFQSASVPFMCLRMLWYLLDFGVLMEKMTVILSFVVLVTVIWGSIFQVNIVHAILTAGHMHKTNMF